MLEEEFLVVEEPEEIGTNYWGWINFSFQVSFSGLESWFGIQLFFRNF